MENQFLITTSLSCIVVSTHDIQPDNVWGNSLYPDLVWRVVHITCRADTPISNTPQSYCIEYPRVVNSHTCSRLIQREKSKLKGHRFGFLEKDTNVLKFLSPVIGNRSTYDVNLG